MWELCSTVRLQKLNRYWKKMRRNPTTDVLSFTCFWQVSSGYLFRYRTGVESVNSSLLEECPIVCVVSILAVQCSWLTDLVRLFFIVYAFLGAKVVSPYLSCSDCITHGKWVDPYEQNNSAYTIRTFWVEDHALPSKSFCWGFHWRSSISVKKVLIFYEACADYNSLFVMSRFHLKTDDILIERSVIWNSSFGAIVTFLSTGILLTRF